MNTPESLSTPFSAETRPWFLLFVLLMLTLCMGYLYPVIGLGLGAIGGSLILLKLFFWPEGSFKLALLCLFLGILTSLKMGFTFKGVQFFSLWGIIGLGLGTFFKWRIPKPPPVIWVLPFALFILSLLPSFFNVDIAGVSLTRSTSSFRLIFNLFFLFLFTCFFVWMVSSKAKLLSAFHWASLSLALSLGIGFIQQWGYYSGWYNPLQYIGKHAMIVDFYGPFLRIAPGTFANEYGQILQTMGIFTLGVLLLIPQSISFWQRRLYCVLLFLISVALVLNFTRASWLVFILSAFLLFLMARLRLWMILGLSLMMGAGLYGLFYLGNSLEQYNVFLSIGERFEELENLTSASAGLRLQTWLMAWEGFLKHPWIGQGLGVYIETHNVPLQLMAETGLSGLFGYMGFCFWVIWTQIRAYFMAEDPDLKALQALSILAFLGCLAFDLTNHGLFHFVFWFVIAMGLASARLNGYNESKKGEQL